MRNLFEDDDIELEDAVEVISENSIPKTAFTEEKIHERLGKPQKKTFLKVIETGEILTIFHYSRGIVAYSEEGYKVGQINFEPNGQLVAVFPINRGYRNLKIGDFLIKTAIQDYGCYFLRCNGDRAYKIYRKYGLLPIYNGVFSFIHIDEIDFKKNFEDTMDGKLPVVSACTMCDKAHLSEFGLEWSKELEEFIKFMDANYRGENYFGDSKKSYYVFTKITE